MMTKLNWLLAHFQKHTKMTVRGTLTFCLMLIHIAILAADVVGPKAIISTVKDGGEGKIKIAWSLQEATEERTFDNDYPQKVCVHWAVVEDGERGEKSENCFTQGMSTQEDLVVDTGIGADGPTTEYSVALFTYYAEFDWPLGGIPKWVNVTLNDSN